MTTKNILLAAACLAITGCSEAPSPQYGEQLPEIGDAAASKPVEQEPTPVASDYVSVGGDVWRMCDGGRMIYFYTSYKTGAAIAVVLHQPECNK